MQKIPAIIFFACYSFLLRSQNACDLVTLDSTYACVDTLLNLEYGQGRHDYFFPDPSNGCTPFEALHTDIFRPCEASPATRPLILFVHGGSFASGDKSDFWSTCQAFAERGYVAATVQYRLSVSFFNVNKQEVIRAGYRAQQDVRAAVRFFKANAADYHIDTAQIYLMGYSAGAVTALNLLFARDSTERPAETFALASCGDYFGCPVCPDLGPLEGEGGNPGFSSQVRGVFSLAGAVMDLSVIDAGENETPLYLVHGTADETVDYDSACFLNLQPCIKLYGSHSIDQRADALGFCSRLHTIPGAMHDLAPYFDVIVEKASSFFHRIICGEDPCDTTPAKEPSPAQGLKVFPNPAGDVVQVEIHRGVGNGEGFSVVLHNFSGRKLSEQSGAGGFSFDLQGLPAGVYFITVYNSGKVESERVVKY